MRRFFFRGRRRAPRPRLEPGRRIYAVGDIHGRLDLLRKIASLIAVDLRATPSKTSTLVFLGDYVDRGPSSKGVLDFLTAELSLCDERIFLRGNHEDALLEFLKDPYALINWSQFGGLETLVSYGVDVRLPLSWEAFPDVQQQFEAALPEKHRHFLAETRLHYEAGGYLFVHAGVKPGVALADQRAEDLIWIRDEFLVSPNPIDRVVVHGHTPVAAPELLPQRINIDTGAVFTGKLTCLVLEDTSQRLLST